MFKSEIWWWLITHTNSKSQLAWLGMANFSGLVRKSNKHGIDLCIPFYSKKVFSSLLKTLHTFFHIILEIRYLTNVLLTKFHLGSWFKYLFKTCSSCGGQNLKQMAGLYWHPVLLAEVDHLNFLKILLLWSLRGHNLPSFPLSLGEHRSVQGH